VLLDLASQVAVCGKQFSQLDEGAHDGNIDLSGTLTMHTPDSIATPCSVNTNGGLRRPPWPKLDITFCDIKFPNSSTVS